MTVMAYVIALRGGETIWPGGHLSLLYRSLLFLGWNDQRRYSGTPHDVLAHAAYEHALDRSEASSTNDYHVNVLLVRYLQDTLSRILVALTSYLVSQLRMITSIGLSVIIIIEHLDFIFHLKSIQG